MTATPGRLPARWPRAALVGVLAIALLVAVLAAHMVRLRNHAHVGTELDDVAETVAEVVKGRIDALELGLLGARGVMLTLGWEAVTRAQFSTYSATRDVDREFPGVRGIGAIRRVPAAAVPAFEAQAGGDGWPGFRVRQIQPRDGERYVIQYVEPVQRNREAVGLDIASEARRREAADASMQRLRATLSAPITLVQASGRPSAGFLLLLPVREGTDGGQSNVNRRVIGWTYAPLVIDEVLAATPGLRDDVQLRLVDLDAGDAPFHQSAAVPSAQPVLAHRTLELGGRRWSVELRSTPAFEARQGLLPPWQGGAAAFVLTAALGTLLLAQQRTRSARAEAQRERERRALALQVSRDAIVQVDAQGRVVDWNDGAQALLGHDAGAALGRTLAGLLLAPDDADNGPVLARVVAGDTPQPLELQVRHRDGRAVEVSATAAALRDPGRDEPIGATLSLRDIGELKAAQRRALQLNSALESQVAERTRDLETTRHDLQTVLDTVPSQIGYWDHELRNRFANRAYLARFGIDPEKIRGMHASDLLPRAIYEQASMHLAAALAGEPQVFEETWTDAASGNERHAQVHYLPDRRDGRVQGMYVMVNDVTELTISRQRVTAALRESESLLDTVRTHAIISLTDRRGTILDANDAFCRVSRYRHDELVGQNHRIVSSGTHPPAFWRDMWSTILHGRPLRGEVCNRTRDGQLYWVDSMIAPLRDPDGRIERFLSIRFDVTERHRAQQRLNQLAVTLQAVLDASSEVSIIATDMAGRVRVFNRGAERLLGWSADVAVGHLNHLRFHDRTEVQQRREALAAARRCAIDDVTIDAVFTDPDWIGRAREWHYVSRDGRRVPVSLIITPTRGVDGQIDGYLGVATDITRRQQVEAELREATARAEAANRAKSAFLANMSHEIRSPLNAVIGLTYLLGQTLLNPEQRGFVDRIRLSGDTLLATINDVLDLAKVEAGELRVEQAPFALPTALSDVVTVLTIQAQNKGLPLELELSPALPNRVMGDRTRIGQVLVNLLTNAIKFTSQGRVRVQADWTSDPRDDRAGQLRLQVTDTGIGMDAETARRVFEPFVQADDSTTRRFGGTGLGLSIVRQLVELMGGQISVDSEPGRGSRFTVLLPLALAPADQGEGAVEQVLRDDALAGHTLLVVDDSDINRDVARRILERKGARVRLAENGVHALEVLRQSDPPVELVLMDVHMPVMDGFEATRRLRQQLGDAAPPVLALSAGATVAEREAAQAAGMVDYVTKPFDPARLLQTLVQHLRLDAALAPAAVPAAPADDAWPRVEGINAADARERLSDDVRLFGRMLRRLFEQFPAVHLPPAPLEGDARRDAIAQLHKLRGIAGMLAADGVHAHAGSCEDALRDGHDDQARVLVPVLNAELQRLQASAAALLVEPADAAAVDRSVPPVTDDALEDLLQQLRRHSLRATQQYERLAPAIRARFPGLDAAGLARQVRELQFAEVVATLERARHDKPAHG